MQHGDNELHLLLHPLGELLYAAVPPVGNFQAVEPLTKSLGSGILVEPLEAGKVDGLFAYTHLLVESTLLGQVADLHHIGIGHRVTVEKERAAIGSDDVVDDADEGGLACPIGTEETEHTTPTHMQTHAVEGSVGTERLGDIIDCKH